MWDVSQGTSIHPQVSRDHQLDWEPHTVSLTRPQPKRISISFQRFPSLGTAPVAGDLAGGGLVIGVRAAACPLDMATLAEGDGMLADVGGNNGSVAGGGFVDCRRWMVLLVVPLVLLMATAALMLILVLQLLLLEVMAAAVVASVGTWVVFETAEEAWLVLMVMLCDCSGGVTVARLTIAVADGAVVGLPPNLSLVIIV